MGLGDSFLGPVLNFAGGILRNRSQRNQAQAQMDFQEKMSNTAHQREVKDLIAAGINPMLSAKLGGASTPQGAMAQIENVGEAATRGMVQGTQAQLQSAQAVNMGADTELKHEQANLASAQAAETIARTPTHAATIEQIYQNISESVARIQNIEQQVRTGGATEANLKQQTANLQEIIPQIRATVANLKAQTTLAGAHTTLAGKQATLAGAQTAQQEAQTELTGELTKSQKQHVQANLPRLEAALKNLERIHTEMQTPQLQNRESVMSGLGGVIHETLNAINPFQFIMPTLQLGKPAAAPRDTRKDWKK
ncbi:MAG: DNA pilot protein [Microviridae sp.]|nr:MAG: DNA pilot protein [Microviridae sp.]